MKTKPLNSEELLESIFSYMNQLFERRDFSSTIEILTNMGRTLVNCDRASFWFWDQPAGQYWTMAATENSKICVAQGTGIVGATISGNETIVLNHPYEDERFNPSVDKETGYVTKSILCIPVTNAEGEVIGAYQAINKQDEEGLECDFCEADVKRLSLVAVFGGKTLESYLLYNKAFYDQLTGLKNRSGFYEIFHKRILPALGRKCTSLVMCDIDFFKKVNDTYGHNAGDAVLVQVADILKCGIDIGDEAIRWGGEEFILLLEGKDAGQAREAAERLRAQVEQAVCVYEGVSMKITMSFGVEEISFESPVEDNIRSADERLYEAKRAGRNKVV